MSSSIVVALSEAWSEFLHRLAGILPDLLVLLSLLAAGLLAGFVVRVVLGLVLRAVRFDRFAERTGMSESLRRAGLTETPTAWAARIVAWGVVLLFLLVGAASLRIPGTENVLARAFELLPALVAAAVIFGAGLLVARFVGRAVLIGAVNAGFASARFLSRAAHALVVLVATAMALEQIGLARGVVVAAFSILFGGFVLGLSIAFGFGGRRLARAWLERHLSLPPEEKPGAGLDHV